MNITSSWQPVNDWSYALTVGTNVVHTRLYVRSEEDEDNNRSTVYYEWRAYVNYTAWNNNSHTYTLKLGGVTKTHTFALGNISSEPKVLASGNFNINHNDDGTLTSTLSISGYNWETATSENISLTFPTIDVGVVRVKVSGSWKKGLAYIKVGGAWKKAKKVYIKTSGTWKQSK